MRCTECASAIDDPSARVCPACGVWLAPPAAPGTAVRPRLTAQTRPAIAPAPGFALARTDFSTLTELDLEPEVVPFDPPVAAARGPGVGAPADRRDGPPLTDPARAGTQPPRARHPAAPLPQRAEPPSSERPTDAAVQTAAPHADRAAPPTASPLRAFIDGRTSEVTPPLVQFYVLSKRYEAGGDVDAAIACLDEALAMADDPALYNRLGILYARGKHDDEQACRMFARAVELAPGDPIYAKNLRKAERRRARARRPEGSGGRGR